MITNITDILWQDITIEKQISQYQTLSESAQPAKSIAEMVNNYEGYEQLASVSNLGTYTLNTWII